MKKLMKKIGVLLGVFIIAVAIYFIWAQGSAVKKAEIVYTSMEEPSLPVVYAEMFGKRTNRMHGFMEDQSKPAGRGPLTVLPQDRRLTVQVDEYGNEIETVRYEIRSLDQEQLVERTDVESWNSIDGKMSVILPIQNLLIEEQEYLLHLTLGLKDKGEVHYYSRVVWSANQNVETMINFAADFSAKTLDYKQAMELVTYLETNSTQDNSSLGQVTIKSSFNQLTWAGLKMELVGDVSVQLDEMGGDMAIVQLEYFVSRQVGEEKEVYEVSESFTMKWNTQRIYLMDFIRTTDQIFMGSREDFNGKRIMLGITNDERVRVKKSENGQYLGFVANRDLWCYDQSEGKAVKVFSFRSGTDDGVRSNYKQHDIKILSVQDNGNVDFLVYGYMNRGRHEGMTGTAMYRYDQETGAIKENFFIPGSECYELLKKDMEQLSYLGNNDMLYLLLDRAVYAIDLNSGEYMVVADGLLDGSYAVSSDGRRFAWQEGRQLYEAQVIHLMDLDTGKKQEISSSDEELLRVLGFVGNDFVYGLAQKGDEWVINGRIQEFPMHTILIVGENMEVETTYEKEGLYISSVDIQESRIHMKRNIKLDNHNFAYSDEDTLVCNAELGPSVLDGVGWYASQDRRKLYFVQLDQEIKNGQYILVDTPKNMSNEEDGMLKLKSADMVPSQIYYAYGEGRLLGTSEDFADALSMAYSKMGFVTDRNQRVLWNRVDRRPSRTIKDPVQVSQRLIQYLQNSAMNMPDDMIILDARGCSLNQILYFIGKGCPVVAYKENGEYVLLNGYDQYNVSIYNPQTGESSKMGLNDANTYFENLGNDFVCALFSE